VAAAAAVLATLVAAPAQAFSGLYVFGDSLSDNGNFALATALRTPAADIAGNGYIPTYPYTTGNYSNGPVWADRFAAALGLSAAPSLSGAAGTNFAFGGAETSVEDPATGNFPPSLKTQIDAALLARGGVIPADALIVYAGGGNNALRTLTLLASAPASSFAAIVGAEAAQFAADVHLAVDTLQLAGARNIVVWNTPNVGLAPASIAGGAAASFAATSVSSAMNDALFAALAGETDVRNFDVFGLLGSAVQNPAAFGLANATDACGAGAVNCATALFYDGIHPTTAGHALLAGALLSSVAAVPEPSTFALMCLGLVVCAGVARHRAGR
jgi:outer membrane lipase/esterase